MTLPAADVDALAVAIADWSYIETHGNIKAGDTGIVAVSIAKAEAEGDNPAGHRHLRQRRRRGQRQRQGRGHGHLRRLDRQGEGSRRRECEQPNARTAGNVTVTVNKGKVQGGDGYYGIVIEGGDDNVITVGKKATVTSKSRHAILGGDQGETVNNYGLVWGEVDLGGGFDQNFFNYARASSTRASSSI